MVMSQNWKMPGTSGVVNANNISNMSMRYEDYRSRVGHLDLLDNVLRGYRKHVTQKYGLGSPNFNKYYF